MKYLKNGKYSLNQKDVLGSGSFGKVFRGYNHQQNHYVALKQIALQKLDIYGDQMKQIICSQITVMRKFSKEIIIKPCPYLVRNQDCFRTQSFIYIVMQLCEGGTLLDQIYNKKTPEKVALNIIYQIYQGVRYLAQLAIVHRDLKPQNIFIKKDISSNKKIYKIGDFGFAAQKKVLEVTMGTYPYMAPEVFNQQKYGLEADIWSLGIIAHQILFGQIYFLGKNKWDIAKNVKEKPYVLTENQRLSISQQTHDFLKKCLQKDQFCRITHPQIDKHPVFSQFRIKQEEQARVTKAQDIPENKAGYEKLEASILKAMETILQKCKILKSCAQQFSNFSFQTKRKTEFIQIYLLKQSYINLNRLSYSLAYKQNHLPISQQLFNKFVQNTSEQQYKIFLEKVQAECLLVTSLFNAKFKDFKDYVNGNSNFSEQDKAFVWKIVNQQPYSAVNTNIFSDQLVKWSEVLRPIKEWQNLYMLCMSILE